MWVMKKRIIILILIIVLLIIIPSLFFYFIFFKSNVNIELIDNLNLEVNSEVYISSLIKNADKIEISSDDLIDTTKIGSEDVTLKYVTHKKEKEYNFKINVVDTISPIITYEKEISTTVGSKIDLTKNVNATDNSKEEIEVEIEGDYDFNKVGEYALKYVAKDASQNETCEEFTLKVVAKDEKTYYYKKLEEPSGEKELVGTTTNGYNIYKINGSIYIDGILIANKTYALADNFVPENTYKSAVGVSSQCATCINKTAYSAWLDMKSDAASLGLNIWIQSGYRPYSTQVTLYNNYVARDGKDAADTYSSRPGHSEHQTGLSFDLNSISDAFANTKEGKWVNENAYLYGFIIRFPKGSEDKTGYKYESWHLRYVGTDLAKKLYNNGNWISLEEYFGITSTYSD
jgi:D-alanyl-D-alanine dipeptidase